MTTIWQVVSSPGTWFLAFIILFCGLRFWLWRRRNEAFLLLAERYGLHEGEPFINGPDPGVRGFFFPARYQRYFLGQIEGVRVIVFDYLIPRGRNGNLRGSGVGVQKRVVDEKQLLKAAHRSIHFRVWQGWTFAYTGPHSWLQGGWHLTIPELENLWRLLLRAPALDLVNPDGTEPSGPGEIFIKPRH